MTTDELRPCVWCGVKTSGKKQACTYCAGVETRGEWPPRDKFALTGGQWVSVAGVHVWVPTGEQPPRPPRPRPFIVGDRPTIAESAAQIVAAVETAQRRGRGAA